MLPSVKTMITTFPYLSEGRKLVTCTKPGETAHRIEWMCSVLWFWRMDYALPTQLDSEKIKQQMCYPSPRTENCISTARRHRTCQVPILEVSQTEWSGPFLFQVMWFFSDCHYRSNLNSIDEFLVQYQLYKDDQVALFSFSNAFQSNHLYLSTEHQRLPLMTREWCGYMGSIRVWVLRGLVCAEGMDC